MMKINDECPYCIRAKRHSKRHKNDTDFVICLPHRVIRWLCDNAYNWGDQYMWRNPLSAHEYSLHYVLEPYTNTDFYTNEESFTAPPPPLPQFAFEIIAKMPPLRIKYPHKDQEINLYPVVIADIVEGQYDNRRFAVIFSIKGKWGILFNKIEPLFNFIGFNNIEPCIDTCSWGKAKSSQIDKDLKFYKQRVKCSECQSDEI